MAIAQCLVPVFYFFSFYLRDNCFIQRNVHACLLPLDPFISKDISSLDPEKVRADLEHQLAEWSSMDRGTAEQQQMAQEAWRKYELLTSNLSQDLCEQLRLVLEPSLATKLKYVEYSSWSFLL